MGSLKNGGKESVHNLGSFGTTKFPQKNELTAAEPVTEQAVEPLPKLIELIPEIVHLPIPEEVIIPSTTPPASTSFCFVISCHNMVSELLAHLDILYFCRVPNKIIVIHSGTQRIKYLVESVAQYIQIEPKGHSLGAVLAVTKGIRAARESGHRYMCFRNGDDWVFNHSRVEFVLHKLKEGFKLAGYNWFGRGNYDEYALNELYIDVRAFDNINLDFWDGEFIAKVKADCERHFARMIKEAIPDTNQIFKLSDRERYDGIGHVFSNKSAPDNNRWFNLQWQLVGDHDDVERRKHWDRLKPFIPYAEMLEHKNLFKCWLEKIQIF